MVIAGVCLAVLSFRIHEEVITISYNDTVTVYLPSRVPSSLELQLFGKADTCTADVIRVKCNHIQTNASKLRNPPISYTYLVEGSSIVIDEDDIPEKFRPYQVWIFDSLAAAREAVSNHFNDGDYNCADRQRNCLNFDEATEGSLYYNITKSSYYFMRCKRNNYACSELQNWYFEQVSYDFSSTKEFQISSVTVQGLDDLIEFTIRSPFFPTLSATRDSCILIQLNESTCFDDDFYFLYVNYLLWPREYAVYVATGTAGWLVIALIGTVLCIYCSK